MNDKLNTAGRMPDFFFFLALMISCGICPGYKGSRIKSGPNSESFTGPLFSNMEGEVTALEILASWPLLVLL